MTQRNDDPASKLWEDYDNVEDAMDGVCRMYERHLKKEYPTKKQITYDVANLFDYIQDMPDMSCLVFSDKYKVYEPKGKQWIKDEVLKHLKKQAAAAAARAAE